MTTYLKEDFLYDASLLLEDSLDSAGAVSAITAAQVGKVLDVAKVLDVGDGVVEGYMIVDIDAIDVTSQADLLYAVLLQATNVAAFATAGLVRDIARVDLGAGEMLTNAQSTTGDQGAAGNRYVIPFRNVINGTVYRYLRSYSLQEGTGDTITMNVWLTIKRK